MADAAIQEARHWMSNLDLAQTIFYTLPLHFKAGLMTMMVTATPFRSVLMVSVPMPRLMARVQVMTPVR